MSIERKIARRMAKAQMKQEGIQHPCGELQRCINTAKTAMMPGRAVLTREPKFSRFSAMWRQYALKRHTALEQSYERKLAKEARRGRISKPICVMGAYFGENRGV